MEQLGRADPGTQPPLSGRPNGGLGIVTGFRPWGRASEAWHLGLPVLPDPILETPDAAERCGIKAFDIVTIETPSECS